MRSLVIKYTYFLIFLLFYSVCSHAQKVDEVARITDTTLMNIVPPDDRAPTTENGEADSSFRVTQIIITGNKKTKAFTILRELTFKEGHTYTLQQLLKEFEISRQFLMNTALFHEAIIALQAFHGQDVEILVDVKERWYIFPIPYFKLVDRNLNQWWVEQNKSLERVNYGLKFTYYNFTGRKDKLKLWLVNGYNRQVQLRYEQPYADQTLKHGYNIGFSYQSNREINYATIDDKQSFVKNDGFIRDQLQINLEYVYRPAYRTKHTFKLIYTDEKVEDTVLHLNPEYFNSGMRKIRFPELAYTLEFQNVDYIPYPQHGFMGDFTFSKQGFNKDMNVWSLSAKGNFNRKLTPKISYTIQANASIKLPFNQPFYAKKLLGFGDNYLRGLEYYVVDGVAGGLLRTTIRREMLSLNLPNPLKSNISKIPIKFYLKAYGDAGYVYNRKPEYNRLPNRMLYTSGIGIDIVTIYDFVLKFEFSFNQLGQNGLFLHNRSDF